MDDPITIDFETEAIVGNPIINPPKPVGVAVWVPGCAPEYLSWGHSSGNNISFDKAHQYLKRLVDSRQPFLFHNAPFDISVWNFAFCNAIIDWRDKRWKLIHDTMYLLFLSDPYAVTLSLKPSAERYLDMASLEQSAVRDWILANIRDSNEKNWGGFISLAPADLVSEYAIGDVIRTRKLYDLLLPRIIDAGMEDAYNRERKLFPILHEATKRGIRIDRHTLEHHERVYTQCLEVAEGRLSHALGVDSVAGLSSVQFTNALEQCGAVSEWVLTKTGKRSVSRDNLRITNPEIKTLYEYTSALETCLQTFMRPWLELSRVDGRLHPNWNQVRQPRDDRSSKGTRTGRLSSDNPNFQNVPTEFNQSIPEGLHPLPLLRQYCLPDDGYVWLKRDYSSQEIRILAHFEDGSLCGAYKGNPNLDPHQMALDMIATMTGVVYARKDIKITGFSIIYGTGNYGLSVQLVQPIESAAAIKSAYLAAMPAVRHLMDDVQRRGRAGQPIKTWGGRLYYTESPGFSKKYGRMMTYEYKLLNYLIQGSAADQTKESICDWNDNRTWEAEFLATVHDENNIQAPAEDWERHMQILKTCMERERFDVPMLSEGYKGFNWHELEACI